MSRAVGRKTGEWHYLIDGASTPLLSVLLRMETAAVPSSGGRSKPHAAAGALLPSKHFDGNDMRIWNLVQLSLQMAGGVDAVGKQNGIWNVQPERQPVHTKVVFLCSTCKA